MWTETRKFIVWIVIEFPTISGNYLINIWYDRDPKELNRNIWWVGFRGLLMLCTTGTAPLNCSLSLYLAFSVSIPFKSLSA